MGIGPLGIWEILVIVGVALLIFGPAKLPEIARGVGKAVKSFRDVKDEVTGAVLDDEPRAEGKSADRTTSTRPQQTEQPTEASAKPAESPEVEGEGKPQGPS